MVQNRFRSLQGPEMVKDFASLIMFKQISKDHTRIFTANETWMHGMGLPSSSAATPNASKHHPMKKVSTRMLSPQYSKILMTLLPRSGVIRTTNLLTACP
jgi:hypothetical protein